MYIYTLPHIIKKAAKQKPNGIAFKFLNEKITFLDLDIKSTQLATFLINSNIKKGDRVGIYMPRCLESTIAVYGVLKAGAVYVPLDPFSPILRTEFVINDCNISHLITVPQQTRKVKKLINTQKLISVVGLDKISESDTKVFSWNHIFKTDVKNFTPVNILDEDLAYILYTSGSTGTPKGIMHTHKSALAFVNLVANLYQMNGETYGMHAPLHFDPSVQGYFAAPFVLAKTIIVSDAHTKMPASIAELIEKEKITIWFSVPLALIQMLTNGNLENRNLSSLKWVLFSGEVFTTKYLRELMLLLPKVKFSNIYGPTETNQCTNYNLEIPPEGDKTIPIGNTWGNTEYKILNSENKEVEKGKQGELVVRTATMMKGYWNNLQLTQKSFYKETLINGFDKLYYKTGDQVQENERGELLFFGRKDHQIKLRGYRIELGEIENVLTSHESISEAVALIIFNKEKEEKELIVAILSSKNTQVSLDNIKQYCQKKLSLYAVPEEFYVLEKFPRTASGKVSRKEIETIITSK